MFPSVHEKLKHATDVIGTIQNVRNPNPCVQYVYTPSL